MISERLYKKGGTMLTRTRFWKCSSAMSILAILLCMEIGCSAPSHELTEYVNLGAEKDIETDFEGYYEVNAITEDKGSYNFLHARIIVPKDTTEDEIMEYSKAYIQAKRGEDSRIYTVLLWFYDNLVFEKYNDINVACVRWSPDGRLLFIDDKEVGDFSNHKVVVTDFNPCDYAYELTDEEMGLYDTMQGLFVENFGEPAPLMFNEQPLWRESRASKYDTVAELLGVDRQTLIDLRIKVCLWRRPAKE